MDGDRKFCRGPVFNEPAGALTSMAYIKERRSCSSAGIANGLLGTSLPPEIGMPFSFAMVFGFVMFLGWVIGRVRVLLSENKFSATLTPGSSTHDAPVSTPASVVEDDGATVVASLCRLKALHDDGILTNDEYETKRKALTDEL